MRKLRASGRTADDVLDAIARLDVRPVLTAHPTESTRRTLLALQARVADLLLAWESTAHAERRALEEQLASRYPSDSATGSAAIATEIPTSPRIPRWLPLDARVT